MTRTHANERRLLFESLVPAEQALRFIEVYTAARATSA